jgi:uncharacterized heparinase superfamily protein
MSSLFRRFMLYVNTTRRLRVGQLVWFIYRRSRPVIYTAPVEAEATSPELGSHPFVAGPQPDKPELRFINVSRPADPDNFDWQRTDVPKLWRYNVHYFDFLQWRCIPASDKALFIDSWIAANPMGKVDAWSPYTTSLRIVNWIKYFPQCNGEVSSDWQLSLINQANWLCKNLERELLANHLLKNAKALVFAGVWFRQSQGERLLRLGLELFVEQIREQFLKDGGHFERSPMYHVISLEDCLDVYNILADYSCRPGEQAFVEQARNVVREVCLRGLRFLDDILGADGNIPLFNDAAHGIAPDPSLIIEYGRQLVDYERAPRPPKAILISKPQSGYYGYQYGPDSLVVDCGSVGPDFQAGHAHCDNLSYELCKNGKRLIVDSGVYGYHDDETRNILRGTAAHNTVVVNGAEQSEIWGTFRVARRAEPISASIAESADGGFVFEGSHNGYQRLPEQITHARKITGHAASGWMVSDTLTGRGACDAISRIHFHPDTQVEELTANEWSISVDGQPVAKLVIDAHCSVALSQEDYCPEFGLRLQAPVISVGSEGELPVRLGYQFVWIDHS